MQYIDKLEYHVTDLCNLSCQFCNHYSNLHKSRRMMEPADAAVEWTKWAAHLIPREFILLGGEPTMNPRLEELVSLARQTWSRSRIVIWSNGHWLQKHPRLHEVLAGGALKLSLYAETNMAELHSKLARFHGVVDVEFNDFRASDTWLQFYKLEDGKPQPFTDNDPAKSWEHCPSKHCHVLRDGALWKCPQVAYHKSVGIDWPAFTAYEPLQDPLDFAAWIARKHEHCCSCCPAGRVIHNAVTR